jgi:ribosomal protein S18 acetylase RimI-like enzyme
MVAAIGVRRPWRGRGLGRALLLHTFAEFQRRGVNRISLGVDTQNPTGATKLYESVGMRVELEDAVFEKALA